MVTYKSDHLAEELRWNEVKRHYPVREKLIRSTAAELGLYLDGGLMLVHGGGTHGHRTVLRWKEEVVRGKTTKMAWEVKWRMDQLSEMIIRTMGEEGIPAVSVSPSDIMRADGEKIDMFDPTAIVDLLERGMVPVLRGDLVPDIFGGWSVVSGDEQMVMLAFLGAKGMIPPIERAGMMMSEDGFHTSYGTKKSRKLDSIGPDEFHRNLGKWERVQLTSKTDASGGIINKLKAAHRIASLGIDTSLFGGMDTDGLRAFLRGDRPGTLFKGFEGDGRCSLGICQKNNRGYPH